MKKFFVWLVVVVGFCFSLNAGAVPPNLIQNGSFEVAGTSGLAYEWKKSSWGTLASSFSYPVLGRTGKAMQVSIQKIDPFASDVGAMVEMQYLLSVRAGEKYAYLDYLRGTGSNVYLDVCYMMSNGSFLYRGLAVTKTGSVWQKTGISIVVPTGAVAMSVYRVADSVGTFILDDVSLTAPVLPVGKGYVTFSFDDGRNERSVISLMKNLGVRGTFFLNPTPIIEQWEPGVVFTSSDVNTLVKDGHEIANHTLTHPSLIGLSSSELTRQVVGSKTLLENMTGRSVLTFAYPFGDVDANAYNLVKRYHIGARGVLDASLNTRTSDRYNLNAFTPLQNTPVSAVLSRIDQAASKGQWLILFFHSIGPGTMGMYSYLPQNLTTAINYAKQKTQIITVREGLSGFIN